MDLGRSGVGPVPYFLDARLHVGRSLRELGRWVSADSAMLFRRHARLQLLEPAEDHLKLLVPRGTGGGLANPRYAEDLAVGCHVVIPDRVGSATGEGWPSRFGIG